MNLDPEKLTIARRRFATDQSGMAYLLQPIRRELEERARLAQPSLQSILIIDFEHDRFKFPQAGQVEHSSLFDSAAGQPRSDAPLITPARAGVLFDCVVSNLQGTWFEFEPLAGQVKQLLKPGGIFCFSAFGPDTLAEVGYAWKKVDSCPHVHPFTDMHHLGDMLLQTGFEKPVVDTDWMQVEYADWSTIVSDLRSEGFINLHAGRRKSLTGKQRFGQFESHLTKPAGNGKKVIITFEIIYGYARKPRFAEGQVAVNPPTTTPC